jgi:hypothetical protein
MDDLGMTSRIGYILRMRVSAILKGGSEMINFLGCTAQGVAIASGAITLETLQLLVDKNLLSRAEARGIVQSSIDCLEPRVNVSEVACAIRLMREKISPLFAEPTALS